MTITTNSTPTSTVAPSGSEYVNALLHLGKWGGPLGSGVSLTFSFPGPGSLFRTGYGEGEPFDGFGRFTTEQQQATRAILADLSRAVQISFIEVADTGNAAGELRFALSNAPSSPAQAYNPGNSAQAGDVWVRNRAADITGVVPGSFNYMTLVHEIGHALGLKHPHEGDVTLPASWDTRTTTVMSYEGNPTPQPMAFLPLDLMALQYLYGANLTATAGNNTYRMADVNAGGIRTIWDAGGTDLLDLSNTSADLSIKLSPFALNSGAVNFAIAWDTLIEYANTGSGNDTVDGNDAANWIQANAGRDTLRGFAGADLLDGGQGDDILWGGTGDDLIQGGYGRDVAGYSLASNAVRWIRNSDGSVTVGTGGEGVDRLVNVEALQLLDRKLGLVQPLRRDFDGDGRGDLLTQRASDGTITAFTFGTDMTGDVVTRPTSGATLLGTADVTGDGAAELIWRLPFDAGLQFRSLNGGSAPTLFDPGANWSIRAVGDFDGDTRADLLWGNAAGQSYIWLMDGTGTVTRHGSIGSPGAGWSIQGSGDLNGDGRSDIVWRHTDGVVWSWLMDGTTIIGNGGQPSPGANWSIKGIGDLDGDVRADIVWRSDAGLVWSWFMDGAVATRNASIGNPGASWDIVAVADASGDGVADIISRNTSGISWYWVMQGAAIADSGFVAQQGTGWNFIG